MNNHYYFIIILILAKIYIIFAFDARRDVYFQFYSSNDDKTYSGPSISRFDTKYHQRMIIPSNFNNEKQTFLYIHGYRSKTKTQIEHAISFFESIETGKYCCNFIILNWTEGNQTPVYTKMKERSRSVRNCLFNTTGHDFNLVN